MSQIQVADEMAASWRMVVYIQTSFPSGSMFTGSGVMVGINDVLTASHLLYNAQQGGAATSVTVIAAYDPSPFSTPYGQITTTSYSFHSNCDPTGRGTIAAGNGGGGLAGSELDTTIIGLPVALGSLTGWIPSPIRPISNCIPATRVACYGMPAVRGPRWLVWFPPSGGPPTCAGHITSRCPGSTGTTG